MTKIVGDILLQSFLIFVAVGCVVSLMIGVGMLIKPERVLRLNQYLSRWFATDKLAAALDTPHSVEIALYRRHRSVGALVLAGGLYIVYVMLFAFNKKAAGGALDFSLNPQLAAWMMDALGVLLILSSVLGLVIGFFLVVRPSVFKPFEEWGNRWHGTEKSLRVIETMNLKPDQAMTRNYRVFAALIIAGSLYVILSLWLVLF